MELHPLHTPWTFQYHDHNHPDHKLGEWTKGLSVIGTIRTVEEFISACNVMKPPSSLEEASYYLFREGIDPTWEHPRNENGGRIAFVRPFKYQNSLDTIWYNLLTELVTESLGEDALEITGIAVTNSIKFHVWISTQNKEVIERITQRITTCAGLPKQELKVRFQPNDKPKDGATLKKT
jgi:translation initiation factor 4E